MLNSAPNSESLDYLNQLNEPQQKAVTTTEGPLLVLAGAGTGKTKVLITRIAHILVKRLAFPSQILSVTFTNKAANEMKERVAQLISDVTEGLWLGTFHAIAAKILRRHADLLGLTSTFTIIDYDDQIKLARQIFHDFEIDEKSNPLKLFLFIISSYKDKAWLPENVPVSEVGKFANSRIIQLYTEYQKRLKMLNAVDFGDLLIYNIKLFNENLDICSEYQRKFKYILVDEYQDTNVAQYLWLRILAQEHNNICCVGDDDQSIYGWRGAQVENILKFDKDFKNAEVIRLEQNYRSTHHILNAASHLISNNNNRHGKTLWTEDKKGNSIQLNGFYDDKEEASFIANKIDRLQTNTPLSKIAILLRAGFQTRTFEESLNSIHIPYKIIGGMKFYERAEVKDVIAYIRLLVNKTDNLAFERITNLPKRGIGKTSIQHLYMIAREQSISLFDAIDIAITEKKVKGKAAENLVSFTQKIIKMAELLKEQSHVDVIDTTLNECGYIEMWKMQNTEDAKDRLDNIKELLRGLGDYNNLQEYLEHVSLLSANDSNASENQVNIMTMHAAKGLEFETVFLAGWEEGIFPSQKTLEETGTKGLEEERRLAYVGITRAKKNLYISYANSRMVFGRYQYSTPSRFIDELPKDCFSINNAIGLKNLKQQKQEYVDNSWYQPSTTTATFSDEQEVSGLKKGQRVFHDKFGYGLVLSIEGSSARVAFEKTNTKKVKMDFLK